MTVADHIRIFAEPFVYNNASYRVIDKETFCYQEGRTSIGMCRAPFSIYVWT